MADPQKQQLDFSSVGGVPVPQQTTQPTGTPTAPKFDFSSVGRNPAF
jgi:hypothetical protein